MMTNDDLYIAVDERARDARISGLQAKKDEQSLNTTRSYASKQREWKARLSLLFFTCDPPKLMRAYRAGAARRAPRRTALYTPGRTASSSRQISSRPG
jgi:hypothetical protein